MPRKIWPLLARESAPAFAVEIGDRGRFVLPAPVRRRLAIKPGDHMTMTIEPDGSLRLLRRADVIARARGAYRDVEPGRSWAEDLIAERKREAKREDGR